MTSSLSRISARVFGCFGYHHSLWEKYVLSKNKIDFRLQRPNKNHHCSHVQRLSQGTTMSTPTAITSFLPQLLHRGSPCAPKILIHLDESTPELRPCHLNFTQNIVTTESTQVNSHPGNRCNHQSCRHPTRSGLNCDLVAEDKI